MKFLGFGPLQIDMLKMVAGTTGKQTYSDIGFLVSSMHGFKLKEGDYRPRFLDLCRNGLLRWEVPEESKKLFKDRKFRITEKGRLFIADLQIHFGGDSYFYRYYSGNPDDLDRFITTKHSMKGSAEVDASRRKQIKAMQEAQIKQEYLRVKKTMVGFGNTWA